MVIAIRTTEDRDIVYKREGKDLEIDMDNGFMFVLEDRLIIGGVVLSHVISFEIGNDN